MKSIFTWFALLSLSIFPEKGLTQSDPDFKIMTLAVLNADSLVINDQTDRFISELKNKVDTNPLENLDLNYYNLAVCYASKKQPDSTCAYLLKCISESSNYNNLILTDTDFEFLHECPCWEKISYSIDSAYLSQNPEIAKKELALELYHIFLRDQQARGLGLKCPRKNMIMVDKENLEKVEKIIKEHGWPTYSMVGKTSAEGAFLVIQHSDVNTQRKYFNLILNAAKNNEASRESVALLMDRISVQLKGMQVFGTQVYQVIDPVTGKPGAYKYFPIKDEANIDSLRNEFGLIPIKQYFEKYGIDYEAVSK